MRFAKFYELSFLLALLFCALADPTPTNLGLRKLEEDKNFIRVKYKEATNYPKGFGNDYRKGIKYIKKGDTTFQVDQELSIGANEIIEIYFSEPIEDLTMFFGYKKKFGGDEYNKNILSVDFTDFDSSKVERVNSLFYGCSSIEEIVFNNFVTSGNIETMNEMFQNCINLRSIDLSKIDTSSVKEMEYMFSNCSSLKFLDISNFNLTNLVKTISMFEKISKLEYINLANIITSDVFNTAISSLNKKDGLIACQTNEIISEVTNLCCPLYKETGTCSENNFIVVKYNKNVNYPYGFGYNTFDRSPNKYRSEIAKIKCSEKLYLPDEALDIPANTKVEIFFNSSLVNLTKFFYYYDDPNVENIKSISLAYFNSSLLESMDSAFSGCTSLESIDLTNFEAPLLTNMNNAFFHCSSLKGIDLSYINSSSITFINRIFCGCNSLKSLNLANLNLTNIKDASYAFYNLKNLQFLNILGIEVNDIFKSELFGQYGLNEEKPMAICQNEEEKMITNPNYQYICCNYDNDNNGCECSNNIIIYYKNKTEYTTGFIYGSGKTEIETRKDITYLYADDDIYNITFPFNTSKNSYVKLCFKSPISSLENFFNSDEESSESNNIRSIDLSHFDSSSLNNVRNIFHNCKGLVALDMSNLNFLNVDGFSTMFNNNNDLRYIAFKNVDINKKTSLSFDDNTIIICRNDNTLQSSNPNVCCDFDSEYRNCRTNNYIIVNFSSSYSKGFAESNSNRNSISFINYNNITYGVNNLPTIKGNDFIELHFLEPITSLSSFFKDEEGSQDDVPISYVDFSHFDSSQIKDISNMFKGSPIKGINFTNFNTLLITNMESAFRGCGNLISLDLSNFNTTSVTNMKSMFQGCTKLTSLYLSNFNTSSVTSMESMFNSCQSLKILDISNFIINEKCNSYYMFGNLNNLKYISLINVEIKKDKNQVLSGLNNNLLVCQDKQYIEKSNELCCDINDNKILCKTDNYIKVKYKDQINYNNGFEMNINSRKKISFINLRNSTFMSDDPLTIEKDEIMEIHFFQPTDNLEDFFNFAHDGNVNNIISIDLSHFESSLVTSMKNMFNGCSSIEKINFTNFTTSSVTNMEGLFSQCKSLKSLDLTNFDTQKVKTMTNMFNNCSSLLSLDLSKFITSNVEEMNNMFSGCQSLQYLDISHFHFSNLGPKKFLNIFNGLNNLKYINLYDINIKNELPTPIPLDLPEVFDDLNKDDINDFCQNSHIPETLQSNSYIQSLSDVQKINLCIQLRLLDSINDEINKLIQKNDIIICKNDQSLNNNIINLCSGKIYYSYPAINYITIKFANGDNTDNSRYLADKKDDYFQIKKGNSLEIHYTHFLPDLISTFSCDSVDILKNKKAKSFDFSHLDASHATSMKSMLSGCNSVEKINFTNFDTSSVTDMSEMFNGCNLVENIISMNFNTSSVTDMSNMFNGCKRLKSLNLLTFDTSSVTDMNNMFNGCEGLESLNLLEFDTSSVQNMDKMFNNGLKLKILNLTNFDTSSVTSMKSMFYNCDSLEYLFISNFNLTNLKL